MTEGGDETPDVVLVCCGGGGLLSGISAALKLSCTNSKCTVYGVEPYGGSNSCHSNFKTMMYLGRFLFYSFPPSCFFFKFLARTMYESFEQGKAVSMDVKTVASGLSPPKAGDTCRNLHLLPAETKFWPR